MRECKRENVGDRIKWDYPSTHVVPYDSGGSGTQVKQMYTK